MTALWVVVPAYQEEARIGATLEALARQNDRDFTLLVVDNGSSDTTVSQVESFAARKPFPVRVIMERQKGVGYAVDTGFRYAIDHGAQLLARTDADCLPHAGWVAAARAGLRDNAMVCGSIRARHDEHGWLARAGFGRLRPANKGDYRAPYRMHAGNNMAITADLYLAVGGMPRRESPTDRLFLNRVRTHTAAIGHSRNMIVENSTRRLRTYGLLRTAHWYLDRGSGPLNPDPR
jgi:glycosyltransferase involved in cell wall biosynthesis